MYKKITIVLAALCLVQFAQAQDEHDALLLSRGYQFGTARNMSLSGATGSLGADFGAISNNPAGLGLYRKSELSFTPNVINRSADGDYQTNSENQVVTRFNFNQAGIVFANAKKGSAYKKSRRKTSNFSIGFNRLASLYQDFSYRGNDNKSSFVENFSEELNNAGGYNDDAVQLISEAAYGAIVTKLVDADLNDTTVAASYVPYDGGLLRKKSISREGGINELSFSYGANYNEKVIIGVTLGIPMVNLRETEVLSEEDISGNTDNDFKYVDLVQNLRTEGSGLNLKFGAIFRPNKDFRVGIAVHTPTWYSLTDVSNIIIESHTENYLPNNGISNDPVSRYTQEESQLFDYTLVTPMKVVASGTALFGKQGFLSADLEYINYEGMKYRYNGFSLAENAVNQSIRQTYQDALNLRIGGEVRVDEVAFRAGYAYYGNPYENYANGAGHSGSLGLGYRSKNFYLDLAGQYLFSQDPDQTHTLARTSDIPLADVANRNTQISLTAGFRF